MAGIATVFIGLKGIYDIWKNTDFKNMDKEGSKALANAIKELANNKKLGLAQINGSITKLLNKYTVSPVIICTDSAKAVEIFDKVVETSTDLFASFYMQAFKLLSTQYDLDITTTIDILSTNTTPLVTKGISKIQNAINFESDLTYQHLMSKSKYLTTISVEDKDKDDSDDKLFKMGMMTSIMSNIKNNKNDSPYNPIKAEHDREKDPLHSILIRTLNLTTKLKKHDGTEHTVIIPININAHVIVTSITSILNLLEPTSKDKSFFARLDEYRAGAISFKELIFANDLIKQYKQIKMKDKDKLFNVINERIESSLIKEVRSGAQGFEANYNMVVITSEDKRQIDKYIGSDLFKENTKQTFLENTHALAVSIIDPDYERVNILISDIRSNSDVSFKTLKKKKSNDGSQLEDFIKAMTMNRPIGF